MESFCKYLVEDIKDSIEHNINYTKLLQREKYLLSARWIRWSYGVPSSINMIQLVNRIINSITFSRRATQGRYVVYMNPREYLYGSSTKLLTVARFLDKGNEKVRGMYFISSVINRYTRNINRYWKAYASAKLHKVHVSRMVIVE